MKIIFTVLFLLFFLPALAVQPDEMLQDAALESRARAVSAQLRCLVCQGQDIDSSGAEIAQDLRRLVRARIAAGDTDAEVLSYVQARYGDYVLMSPPVKPATLALWLAPPLVFLAGLGIVLLILRRGRGRT